MRNITGYKVFLQAIVVYHENQSFDVNLQFTSHIQLNPLWALSFSLKLQPVGTNFRFEYLSTLALLTRSEISVFYHPWHLGVLFGASQVVILKFGIVKKKKDRKMFDVNSKFSLHSSFMGLIVNISLSKRPQFVDIHQ